MIEVEVEDEAWTRDVVDVEAVVQRAAAAAFAHPPMSDAGAVNLTVLLTDDTTVRELNARFRGKDAATNVLSFPAPQSASPHLGDVALADGVCAREARVQGKTLADHLTHLVVHGALHLLGYDHAVDAEAEVMEGLESTVLAAMGVADPYRLDQANAGP